MIRKLLLTVLSYLIVLFVCLTVAQPSTSSAHLAHLQRYLIILYEQYCENASAVDLELFMDARLMRHTRRVIDMIRGWAIDASEEEINVRNSLNYMRSVVLYVCVTYADSLYDLFSAVDFAIDADSILSASQIFRMRTDYAWQPIPCNEIVRFELMQFKRLALRAGAAHDSPYVKVYSTNSASTRFYDLLTSPANANFSYDFKPLRQSPQSNLHAEVIMLISAQKIVLKWNTFRVGRMQSELRTHLYLRNTELCCALKELFETFTQQRNITNLEPWYSSNMQTFISLDLLQRCVEFVLAEYGRHTQHPAHRKYAYALSENATSTLNKNHARLMYARNEIMDKLQDLAAGNDLLAAIHPLIDAMPLTVSYARYARDVTLRINLSCQNRLNNSSF